MRAHPSAKNFWPSLFGFLPKIGPLRVLQLKMPTPATERLFEASFNQSLDRYKKLLTEAGAGQPDLPNDNFDTGEITAPGKYKLADETQAKLLDGLAKQNFAGSFPGSSGRDFWNSSGIPMRRMR